MKPICSLAVLILLAFINLARADEPLPPPRKIETTPAPIVLIPYYRVSAYAVWDTYAVDRSGYFRPRVIATPFGAFYAANGKPYPWTATNSRNVMPLAE